MGTLRLLSTLWRSTRLHYLPLVLAAHFGLISAAHLLVPRGPRRFPLTLSHRTLAVIKLKYTLDVTFVTFFCSNVAGMGQLIKEMDSRQQPIGEEKIHCQGDGHQNNIH